LVRHQVGVFTFSGGQATGEQTAARIRTLMPKFKQIRHTAGRPFLFTFGHSEQVSIGLKWLFCYGGCV
jgi:hypothetical protein